MLPGATVSLMRGAGDPLASTITDERGRAVFENLAAGGDYRVIASMPGYAAVRLEQISVPETGRAEVAVGLAPGIGEQVTSRAGRTRVDLERGAVRDTRVSSDLFADLPIYGREYQKVLDIAPGVQDTNDDGNPNVHGSRERDFRLTVDGVSNVDPLTGKFLSYVNPDAIEEIEIVDAGADASFGGAVGGFGRIVTKSGSNEFEGSFSLFYQDSLFDGDGAGGAGSLEFRTFQPSLYLSGPLVRDRAWFLIAHELVDKQTPIDVVAGRSFVQEVEALRGLDKLTWQLGPHDRISLQFATDPLTIRPEGVDSLTPPESGYVFERGGPTVSLTWSRPTSPRFYWEATAAWSDVETSRRPFEADVRNTCVNDQALGQFSCIEADSGRRSGPYFQDFRDDRKRRTLRWNGELFVGSLFGATHRVKFGASFEHARYRRRVERDPVITFSSIRTIGDINDPNARLPAAQISIQRVYPEFADDTASGRYGALYVSDSMSFGSRLAVTVGLRLSSERLRSTGWEPFDPAAERAAYEQAVAECLAEGRNPNSCVGVGFAQLTVHPLDDPRLYPACSAAIHPQLCERLTTALAFTGGIRTRQPGVFHTGDTNVAPRFSFAWDPWGRGRSKVFGSWGRYYGQTFLLPLVVENGPDQTLQLQYIDRRGLPFGASNNVLDAFSIRTVDRDLRAQHSDEWTLGVEHEIAPETTVAVRWVERRYRDQLQDIDLNHDPVLLEEVTDADLADFPFGCFAVGPFADCSGFLALVPVQIGPVIRNVPIEIPDGLADLEVITPAFNSIYLVGNFNSSRYRAYILELTRRFYRNWEFTASYTWSESFGQAEDFDQVLGDDRTNIADERGPLATDQRHVVKLAGRVFVPRFGGFRLGGRLTYESGLPFSVFFQRPVIDFPSDLTGGAGPRIPTRYAALRTVFPTGQRNDRRNAHLWTLDLNAQKQFELGRVRATVQIDVFNALNDDTQLVTSLFTPSSPVEGGFSGTPAATRRFGRRWQLAVRLNF
ncbi:MAG: hypothetical protein D6738_13365 [Acidobacteria bacterium]|nr:MAG: hypothetical protein D6738_13365 [Acidobacteriota bacterium]